MDISIVIVSWNARAYLEECLHSLRECHSSRSIEIVTVDNASTDGSPEMVATEFSEVTLIRNNSNFGFAKANNIGVRAASGQYIALINSDVRVLPNCLDRLADFLDRNPGVGNVGPRILNHDLSLQSSCRKFPTLWNNFCEASGLHRIFPRLPFFSTEHMLYFAHDRVRTVDVLVGCFWMLRREAWENIGVLDENFFIYAEDVDWCRRCWNVGWKVAFCPEAEAVHYRAASSANDPARFAVEQQRAVLRYWDKYHGWASCLGIRGILLSRHMLRYLLGLAARLLKVSPLDNNKHLLLSSACMEALLSRRAPRKA
jgi:GT2 family glycosyltransferase